MSLVALRRLAHLVLALTLAVGLAAEGVRAAGMSAKANSSASAMAADMNMAAAASAMPMCGKCAACKKDGGCKGDGCMSPGTCAAYCGTVVGLPVVGAATDTPLSESADHAGSPPAMGWAKPPDPYPPRTTILS